MRVTKCHTTGKSGVGHDDDDVDADYVDASEGEGWWMVIAGSPKYRSCEPVYCQVNSAGPFLVASVMGRYVTRPLRRSLAPMSVVMGRYATRPLGILSAGTGLWIYPAVNFVSYLLLTTLAGASERCNGWVSYLLATLIWKTDLPEIRVRSWHLVVV